LGGREKKECGGRWGTGNIMCECDPAEFLNKKKKGQEEIKTGGDTEGGKKAKDEEKKRVPGGVAHNVSSYSQKSRSIITHKATENRINESVRS